MHRTPHPKLLFVYELAACGDQFHAKATVVDPIFSGQLNDGPDWTGWLNGEKNCPVRVSVSRSDVIEIVEYESNANSVEPSWEDEKCFKGMAPFEECCLLPALCRTFVELDYGEELFAPFFLSAEAIGPSVSHRCVVDLLAESVWSIPDVQISAGIQEERNSVDPLPGMGNMFEKMRDTASRMPIPMSCFLPIMLEDRAKEIAGVMRIDEKVDNERQFHVTIWLIGQTVNEIGSGSCLFRRVSWNDGNSNRNFSEKLGEVV